jgi:hypothetical protein
VSAGGLSARVQRRVSGWLLPLAVLVGVVEGCAGAIPGAGYKVAVGLVRDLDAVAAEPAGDLGDRHALGSGGVVVAQRVRDELRRQAGFLGGPLEGFLVAAADDQLVLPSLEQVPIAGRAVLVDGLAGIDR